MTDILSILGALLLILAVSPAGPVLFWILWACAVLLIVAGVYGGGQLVLRVSRLIGGDWE